MPPPPTPYDLLPYAQGLFTYPEPRPVVAPGIAITGMEMYLQSGAQLSYLNTVDVDQTRFTYRTETHAFTIDWGDNSEPDVIEFEGADPSGPYPNGRVTHVWQDRGEYSVSVTQHFRVYWHGDGPGGSGQGDFVRARTTNISVPVQEIQAVIRR